MSEHKRALRKPKEIVVDEGRRAAAEAQIDDLAKKIDSYITEYSVDYLAAKTRDERFYVPPYQREFTWEPERKSRFIESLLMGLPIPYLFFWQMPDGRLEIVDGSQRLRTIEEYILGDFRLGELESLPAVSHLKFKDLPSSRQRKIENRSIRGIILNEHADEQARFDMFDRINTGSKITNPAELRRGALSGAFQFMVEELATLPQFVALTPVSEKARKEREREELVTRFFAWGDGLAGYKDKPRQFIFDYAKRMNAAFTADPNLIDEYRSRFARMVAFVERVFPFGFRKQEGSHATPRARYEAIAVGSHLAMVARPELRDETPDVSGWLNSVAFIDITVSDGANVLSKLRGRVDFVRNALLGG